ncbi:MAG: DUF4426 domain-containing protein [Pseudomonadales bacterium]|jgi:hypothetical protein|nr:DUF4426 domain-containing protein [Pseudomonadales bacterium]
MKQTITLMAWAFMILAGLSAHPETAHAEQKMQFGDYEVHYIVLPTTFLNAKIADKYNLPRGRDRALVNVSVLNSALKPIAAQITGQSENLLGQSQRLVFTQVTEGDAIYYLALLRHADEEFHRVALDIQIPGEPLAEIRFQQQMFWKH